MGVFWPQLTLSRLHSHAFAKDVHDAINCLSATLFAVICMSAMSSQDLTLSMTVGYLCHIGPCNRSTMNELNFELKTDILDRLRCRIVLEAPYE